LGICLLVILLIYLLVETLAYGVFMPVLFVIDWLLVGFSVSTFLVSAGVLVVLPTRVSVVLPEFLVIWFHDLNMT
jgi:hypothetical protein